jgi:hypothetical protein
MGAHSHIPFSLQKNWGKEGLYKNSRAIVIQRVVNKLEIVASS